MKYCSKGEGVIHKKVGPLQMRNAEFNKIQMNELMGNVLGRES